MATINFVPDDYVQQRRASRANILYLMLLMAMLGAIGITFGFIKMRQRAVQAELAQLNERMAKAQQQIAQLEELKAKSKTMMKTMVMTAELLEPVPRSVILASLTNNLPSGVSLTEFKLEEKEVQTARPSPAKPAGSNQYQRAAATAKSEPTDQPQVRIETNLDIKGLAPSDIQVAGFIARLSSSILFDAVSLVESKEVEIDKIRMREFRLKAALKPGLTLTKEDIDSIREKRNQLM
ncbi:MAG TPA: PilN domain-containing protein [Anaerohalosphaeraceae bacterium]|nr:PilN domain-containing protein [Phycisphaerae bacterium]HOK94634.1 PilN domain-containing protein [Anaerohalosphaeraceae bacterium]HOL30891.1 PilN domain-containing protein [Anaerohalosphaeraceae bacterium]HOM76043.1 PilN domain-containing protein [Anaerohalosphaeraceae bacterium]HPC64207.1 PilN domain-containing protein [Anaerohalosphaeraceae bacterium]